MNTEHLPVVLQFSGVMIAFMCAILLYFAPSIIACQRHHKNEGAIGVLNLFLGWTFVGWVVALVWASTDNTKEGK